MKTEEYVTLEVAKLLKKKGFEWKCERCYIEKIPGTEREGFDEEACMPATIWEIERTPIPALWQAAKWLRDKHNIHIQIETVIRKRWTYTLVDIAPQSDMYGDFYYRIPEREGYPVKETYEAALAAGIEAALKLI